MTSESISLQDIAALTALANGIVPPDGSDAGAARVHAGATLAEKVRAGVNATVYAQGLADAKAIAREQLGRPVEALAPREIHSVLGELQLKSPAFFKQLRMDVSALYLSDPGVWQRIGFPGPSTATGGYPDFDQAQVVGQASRLSTGRLALGPTSRARRPVRQAGRLPHYLNSYGN